MPAGEAGTYTMLRLDGDEVGGLYELEAGRCELGVPSHWFSYMSVEDADATARRAQELGGTVHGGLSTSSIPVASRSFKTPRAPCPQPGSRGHI